MAQIIPQIIFIEGACGRLETQCWLPDNPIGFAVLLHPNPLHGGTLNNKVIQVTAKCLFKKGYICYLPNLRGTGKSAGTHDYGNGECDDVRIVWDYAQKKHPHLMHSVLGGFSFGGYVSCRVAHAVHCEKLLLIAAAVSKYENSAPAVPNIDNTLFIQGEIDDIVPLSEVLSWCAPQNLPVVVLPDAEHFFHGKLPQLVNTINRFF